jgi:hypothetical protein
VAFFQCFCPRIGRERRWGSSTCGLSVTILYFAAGGLILAAAWRRVEHPHEANSSGALKSAPAYTVVSASYNL